MSKDWTPEQLLGYCELHCQTERALFHSDHVNRVIALAGHGPENYVAVGWHSVHEPMQHLVAQARGRRAQLVPEHGHAMSTEEMNAYVDAMIVIDAARAKRWERRVSQVKVDDERRGGRDRRDGGRR